MLMNSFTFILRLCFILSSASAVQGAFNTPGQERYTAAASIRDSSPATSRLRASVSASATSIVKPMQMRAALVPSAPVASAQLRMRSSYASPNSLNGAVPSSPICSLRLSCEPDPWNNQSLSQHDAAKIGKRNNKKRQKNQTRIETAATILQHAPNSSQRHSMLSKITNYYPRRRQRQSASRANRAGATLLYSHPKEKSSHIEDALNSNFDNGDLMVDPDMDASLHGMEAGSNNSTDADGNVVAATVATNGITNEISSSPSPSATNDSPPELFGMPVTSVFYLNLVAIIWGTQHSVIKTVVDDNTANLGVGFAKWMENLGVHFPTVQTATGMANGIGASGSGDDGAAAYFTLARFGLAALLASPYTPGLRLLVDSFKEKLGTAESTTTFANGMDGQGQSQSSQLNGSKQNSDGAMALATDVQSKSTEERESIRLAWKYGAELGLYMFLGYAFQAIGLETTTASRSGFLLYLNVKFVPFLSYFIFGKRIQRNTWISALVAFGGTALLAFDNANAENGLEMAFTVGDLWSIAAAAASALFILRMEAASKAVPKSSELNAANLWTVAVLSLLWTVAISWNDSEAVSAAATTTAVAQTAVPVTSLAHAMEQTFQRAFATIIEHPLPLIYLSGVTTALANFLQSKAQKDVSAERASVIYAMDPVYGAIFANVLLGETLGGLGLAGALLIVVAAATNAMMDFGGTVGETAVGSGDRDKEKK